MPKETLHFLWFAFRFPVIGRLVRFLAPLAAYSALVVWLRPDPTGGVPSPPKFGTETVLTGILFGWLMSFRTNSAYARWWEGRVLWGQLVNESRNLSLKATRLFAAAPEAAARMNDLIAGFADALQFHLRTVPLRVPGAPPAPAGPHVPLSVAGRVFDLIYAERAAGRIDGWAFLTLDDHAKKLMDVCGACERIKNTPLTASYRSLLRKGITFYMVVLPWILAPDLGWLAVPLVLLIGYALIGLELIAASIENPFGYDGDDLPLDDIAETIRKNVTPPKG